MELVLAADPMCSWCYGFAKQMAILTGHRPDVSLKIILGGLSAGGTEILDDAGKRFRLHHWARVEEASGVAFNRDGLLARTGFVYDSEPVCRAVVTARLLRPQADILKVFRAFQHAFYVDALDTTDGLVLAEVGSRALGDLISPVSAHDFFATWQKQSTIKATASDFAKARSMGVASFPTLFVRTGGTLRKISGGYAQADDLEKHLAALAA